MFARQSHNLIAPTRWRSPINRALAISVCHKVGTTVFTSAIDDNRHAAQSDSSGLERSNNQANAIEASITTITAGPQQSRLLPVQGRCLLLCGSCAGLQ